MECEEDEDVKDVKRKYPSEGDTVTSNGNGQEQARPKRFAAQRAQTFFLQEQTSVLFYKEQNDIKKAVKASLIEARRQANKASKSSNGDSNGCRKVVENCDNNKDDKRKSISKDNNNGSSHANGEGGSSSTEDDQLKSVCQSVVESANSKSNKKAKIPAQRKFAQSSVNNTPVSSPIKCESKSLSQVAELFPRHRPTTEDFLTFLCFRNTKLLPPHLDFYALNGHVVVKPDSDTEALAKPSEVTKENSNKTNLTNSSATKVDLDEKEDFKFSSLPPIPEGGKKSTKLNNVTPVKDKEKEEEKKYVKKVNTGGSNNKPDTKLPISVKSRKSIGGNNSKTISSDKQAKDQKNSSQEISKDGKNVNKQRKDSVDANDAQKSKVNLIGSLTSAENDSQAKCEPDTNKRMLRFNRSFSLATPEVKKTTTRRASYPVKDSSNEKRSRSPIGIGIRPHDRKAKPNALIDYHYVIEGEDSDNELISGKKCSLEQAKEDILERGVRTPSKSCGRDSSSSTRTPKKKKDSNTAKSIGKDRSSSESKVSEAKDSIKVTGKNKDKYKKVMKDKAKGTRQAEENREIRKQKILNANKKLSQAKNMTQKKNVMDKRVTRSISSGINSSVSTIIETNVHHVDVKQRESHIRQQIMAIELRHKTMRKVPSDQNIEDIESSSSSESVPSPLPTPATAINIPRLTRSIELIKKLRAKARKELKRQERKKAKQNQVKLAARKLLSKEANKKRAKSEKNESQKRPSSPIGIRPHKRKAKPNVPLIDYHYIIEDDESDIEVISRKKVTPNESKTKENVIVKSETGGLSSTETVNGLKDASSQTHGDFIL